MPPTMMKWKWAIDEIGVVDVHVHAQRARNSPVSPPIVNRHTNPSA